MFGQHFYHQRIRKAVAVFGSLFNELYVVRKNSSNEIISQVKVPLSYAPKRDFIDRIAQMDNGEQQERQVAIKLPRMSFEIIGMNYDPTRQLPKMNKCRVAPSTFDGSSTQLYTPVPYQIQFQLSIYARSQDDALQVVEQILPYFTPQYTVTVNPLDDYDVKEDTAINLTGITFSDDYEGPLEARRTIVYTLDFEMKLSLYKRTDLTSKIITDTEISMFDFDDNDILYADVTTGVNNQKVLDKQRNEDGWSSVSSTYTLKNLTSAVASVSLATQPSHGDASIVLGDSGISLYDGAPYTKATWTYSSVPADWNGSDSFIIQTILEDGTVLTSTVYVNVFPVADVEDDNASIDTSEVGFVDINTSINDTFETTLGVTYDVHSSPSNGSVSVVDGSEGIFRYVPDGGFFGTDSFEYTATPTNGTAETALVTISVSSSGNVMTLENSNAMTTEGGAILLLEQE
jgi:hypothetical protein